MRICFLAASAALAMTMPVLAEGAPSLFQSHFARVAGGEPCYARTYTPEHLKAHPEQRVTDIELDMAKTNPDGKPITEESIELGFGLKVKDKEGWYTNSAICKSDGARMQCFLEGDGGSLTLEAAENGGVKVSTGEYGIAIEGAEDFLEIAGNRGDDRVFVLAAAKRDVCEAAVAHDEKAP